jgi:hypothetical protein
MRPAPYVVYAHFVDGVLIYIGCGVSTTPYNKVSRNKAWKEATAGRSYDIEVLSRHRNHALALAKERRLIIELSPSCNLECLECRSRSSPASQEETLRVHRRYDSMYAKCRARYLQSFAWRSDKPNPDLYPIL